MKICVIGLRGMPGIMGGVETHCEELLPRIAAANPKLDIEVIGRSFYMGKDRKTVGRVRVTPLPSTRGKMSEAITSTLAGLLYARRAHADTLHIHAVGPALLIPLARLLGFRVIFTHHGADYNRAKWGPFAKLALRWGESFGMRFANRIICVSPSLRETMARRYPCAERRTVFIPNGTSDLPNAERCDADVLADFGLHASTYILTVSRLVPEKGLDYLIRAHALSGTPYKLVIAGAQNHGDKYVDQLKQAAGDNVVFLGMVPRSALGTLYRNTACFVLPSFHEGLPIAALEALSADRPMLLSDIPPNRDIGLPEGNYFPVGDAMILSERLNAITGKQADFERFRKNFDWDTISQNTSRVYESV